MKRRSTIRKQRKPALTKTKTVYRVKNWRDYDKSLVQRGSLTFWIDDEALKAWAYQGPPQQGSQFDYSDLAIQMTLTIREVFRLTNRATEGLVQSLFQLLQVDLKAPDHSTLSRRGKTLKVTLPKRVQGELHLVLDSSGLKVYGEGEWKVRQHGWSKRRTWRKMHLAIDAGSGEIQAAILTEAGIHDAEVAPAMLQQVEQPIASVSADGSYDRRLQSFIRPDLLILDDFGLKPLRPPAPEDFYDVTPAPTAGAVSTNATSAAQPSSLPIAR